MDIRAIVAVLAITATGCGGAKAGGAEDASDIDEGAAGQSTAARQLKEGASVCLQKLAGVRYTLEDVLKENDLEPTADCMFADVQIEESGEAGKYVMRYKLVAENDWKTCESTAEERVAFARECTSMMVTEIGGGGKQASAASDE